MHSPTHLATLSSPHPSRLFVVIPPQTGLPVPEFHTFTGTAFTNPSTMHGDLGRAISGQTDRPVDVEKAISMKLQRKGAACTARSPMIVVVVDEIDQLHSHNRQVLRKLFEWAAAPKSRLVSFPSFYDVTKNRPLS